MSLSPDDERILLAHSFRDMRVAVTGGRGFLGRYVCEALTDHGAEVVALGSADYNLIEQSEVRALYREVKPRAVVHLAAACGGIGANVENPGRFLYENAMMGLMMLEEARQAGTEKLVLISTTCAYPQDAPLPQQEDSIWGGPPTGATGPYGMAKRLLHEACETYQRQYGVNSSVVIPANLYGPEDHFDPSHSHVVAALIRRFVEAARAGTPEVVNWGTGTPSREFLHIRDAARGIALALAQDVGPAPMNLGTGVETPIKDLSALIARAAGYEGHVMWDTTKPDGQPRRVLDVSRAAERLGFSARISLEAGIEETVNWFKANH
ncbi:MAG: GDP-L-fucose synthase family protein [Bradymonadia bacterium]